MNFECKLGPYKFNSNSAFTRQFMGAYAAGMQRLAENPARNEGIAVMNASHENFYHGSFPIKIFEGIQPSRHQTLIDKCKLEAREGMVNLRMPKFERTKEEGRFEKHYNYLRGMRPAGDAKKDYVAIDKPYCDSYPSPKVSPFMAADPKESFMSGELDKIKYDLYFNLFPYTPFHFLLVPDKDARHNQFLDVNFLKMAWEFMKTANDPNLRIAFNSLGAHASINHLHFQCFYVTDAWAPPIEAERSELWPLKHAISLPASGKKMVENAYELIECIHDKARHTDNKYSIAYNLYIKPDGMIILPRAHQLTYVDYLNGAGSFSTGPAWIEVLGTIIIPDEAKFNSTKDNDIMALYDKISLAKPPF